MTEFEMLMQQSGGSVPEAAKVLGYSEGHVYRWKRGEEAPRDGVINLLKMQVETLKPAPGNTDFSFIDLLAGIGGLRKAMESAGGRCVFTSEWDRFALTEYVRLAMEEENAENSEVLDEMWDSDHDD